MIKSREANLYNQEEIIAAISQLQAQPTTENFTKFLAIAGSQISILPN